MAEAELITSQELGTSRPSHVSTGEPLMFPTAISRELEGSGAAVTCTL